MKGATMALRRAFWFAVGFLSIIVFCFLFFGCAIRYYEVNAEGRSTQHISLSGLDVSKSGPEQSPNVTADLGEAASALLSILGPKEAEVLKALAPDQLASLRKIIEEYIKSASPEEKPKPPSNSTIVEDAKPVDGAEVNWGPVEGVGNVHWRPETTIPLYNKHACFVGPVKMRVRDVSLVEVKTGYTESAKLHGPYPGNLDGDRQVWIFSKRGSQYTGPLLIEYGDVYYWVADPAKGAEKGDLLPK
jgi:hypothetical protein